MSVEHYENFPVASILCPPAWRPTIQAIYWYARTADDLADEGEAPAAQRRADLQAFRADLDRLYAGQAPTTRWAGVFEALARAIDRHHLPRQPLEDLLSAFEQDVGEPHYPDMATLLDYCRRSADPVGRLLLHLYGVDDPLSLRQSDAICTALQLINFWQDLSVDLPRRRLYVPLDHAARHGLDASALFTQADGAAARALVRELSAHARQKMNEGAALPRRLPGRAGWELRLVVQGGLRILDRIDALDGATLRQRPRIGRADLPRLVWRALRM
ncbi:squalene synthase HpnC [Sphaerotilus hippei]|uniref:Squalene synthase HpnC n=1 Tax=Sphaerotilus hippei TaxID=744406 RepID=A0A318H6L0_9BURK|nr:squalene synthase HpnC [Sphaerotilus hippei]PXW95036.1 squalene synthase HpnC [Sphaerotilus hippei]